MTTSNPLWDEFCDQLRAAGQHLVSESAPQNPFDQAEGVRYLLRLLRYTTLNEIENADPRSPAFASALDPNMKTKIGADNPDNIYSRARISGKYRYRVSGKRGTVPLLTFGTRAARYDIDGTMASTGNLHGHDLTPDATGGSPSSSAWTGRSPATGFRWPRTPTSSPSGSRSRTARRRSRPSSRSSCWTPTSPPSHWIPRSSRARSGGPWRT
ncbi:hypothetical protein [Actinomadura sp. CNU-125]|uniref:hypothetical protein n=1 Tax=Actinomadura sp. CNU-125 TaxID=1904961 RepID=UPI0021CCB229|nr:hypothetical protein [Actinomadura sp. CNU-125]